MRISEADILFIPGLGGSGDDHWQSRWAAKMSTGQTVSLPDLDKPRFEAWIKAIQDAIDACQRPVLVVGHSLGSVAAVHAVRTMPQIAPQTTGMAGGQHHRVRGAFLVTPPSARTLESIAAIDPAFCAIPADPLPFPSLLVASQNDEYATMVESENMALDWGAQVVDAGEAGHINGQSGHGPWPEGLMRLAGFLKNLQRS